MRSGVSMLVLVAVGCSGGGGAGDAGVGVDAGGDAGMPVAAPAAPVLGPCADGWRALEVHGLSVCEPWPAGTESACGPGEARFVGTDGCAPVGAPCPVGAWPDDLPSTGPVLYVQPGLGAEGDGTRDAPFATIARALADARSGTTIALGKGVADEAVVIPSGVSLVGACAAESRIVAPSFSTADGAVTVRGDGVVLRSIGIGGGGPGVVVESGTVALEGVDIRSAREFGLVLRDGGRATGGRLAVMGTRVSATGATGAGVGVFGGSSIELAQVVLDGNLATGLWVSGVGSSATVDGLAVVGTQPQGDGRFGQGIDVADGASATITASVVERNVSGGITATHAGTTIVLRGSVVRDTARSARDGRLGRGVSAGEGAAVTLERVFVSGNAESGVFARGASSTITATDLVVIDTQGAAGDAIDGFGLGLEEGASAEVHRALFAGNQTAGISTRVGSAIVLADVTVRDTRSRAFDGTLGQGIHLEHTARLDRVLLEANRQVGLVIVGAGADAEIADLTIRGTRAHEADGLFGRGLYVGDGSHARVANALVEDNHESGIGAHGTGTTLALERVVVRRTRSERASGQFGVGLVAQAGAAVTVTSGRFEENREIGISARGAGTVVQLTDVVVTGTLERECVATTCPSAGIGVGLGAYTGAQLEARDFVVHANALAGVQLAEGGTMDLHDGVVSSHPIGANIQTAGYDPARINDGVVYRDNQRNLDTSGLPIAEPQTGL